MDSNVGRCWRHRPSALGPLDHWQACCPVKTIKEFQFATPQPEENATRMPLHPAGGAFMLKRWIVCCALTCGVAAGVGAQESPRQNLARQVGTWKLEATLNPGPGGPGAAIKGTQTCRMSGNLQVICDSETIFKERGVNGARAFVKAHSTMTYDAGAKKYRSFAVTNPKDSESSEGTYTGNTWTWNSETEYEGRADR